MWQTLETKARFIHQVMRGETWIRSAEELESGALTYAEIKAIASGNPAVEVCVSCLKFCGKAVSGSSRCSIDLIDGALVNISRKIQGR
jgi:hypothetical protein